MKRVKRRMLMKNSYVLGLCGNAGAGKDMVCDKLCFAKMALADPIKEIAQLYFKVPADDLQRSDKPAQVRWLLQQLGTEIGRVFNPNIWTDFLADRILKCAHPRIVISDVRFPNEAEMLHDLGADLFLIRRPDNPNKYKPMMNHASETSVKEIPFEFFRTAFLNLEGKQDELLQDVSNIVKGRVECHSNSLRTQE
jgi:hypothetical protein